jgi:hypothetical protein
MSKDIGKVWAALKEIDPSFYEDIRKLDAGRLKDQIVSLLKEREEINEAKALDPDLIRIRGEKATAEETYKKGLLRIKTKLTCILDTLESRK